MTDPPLRVLHVEDSSELAELVQFLLAADQDGETEWVHVRGLRDGLRAARSGFFHVCVLDLDNTFPGDATGLKLLRDAAPLGLVLGLTSDPERATLHYESADGWLLLDDEPIDGLIDRIHLMAADPSFGLTSPEPGAQPQPVASAPLEQDPELEAAFASASLHEARPSLPENRPTCSSCDQPLPAQEVGGAYARRLCDTCRVDLSRDLESWVSAIPA